QRHGCAPPLRRGRASTVTDRDSPSGRPGQREARKGSARGPDVATSSQTSNRVHFDEYGGFETQVARVGEEPTSSRSNPWAHGVHTASRMCPSSPSRPSVDGDRPRLSVGAPGTDSGSQQRIPTADPNSGSQQR